MKFRLEVLATCGSTNEELMSRRGSPDFSGTALLALRQTAGVGRRGKDWWSGEGNLALSVALRLGDARALAGLPFAAGLALHDALSFYLPASADIRLKWPNDVYVDGKKISGLISQARQSGEGADVVLGLGVNLQSAPPGLGAACVADYGSAPAPTVFAGLLLTALEARLAEKDFVTAWEERARLPEVELTVVGEAGVYRGRRLLPTGELEVEDEAGALRVLSSEAVSIRIR